MNNEPQKTKYLNFNRLPMEIVMYIMEMLDWDDLCRIECVCRNTRALCMFNQPRLWSKLYQRRWGDVPTPEGEEKLPYISWKQNYIARHRYCRSYWKHAVHARNVILEALVKTVIPLYYRYCYHQINNNINNKNNIINNINNNNSPPINEWYPMEREQYKSTISNADLFLREDWEQLYTGIGVSMMFNASSATVEKVLSDPRYRPMFDNAFAEFETETVLEKGLEMMRLKMKHFSNTEGTVLRHYGKIKPHMLSDSLSTFNSQIDRENVDHREIVGEDLKPEFIALRTGTVHHHAVTFQLKSAGFVVSKYNNNNNNNLENNNLENNNNNNVKINNNNDNIKNNNYEFNNNNNNNYGNVSNSSNGIDNKTLSQCVVSYYMTMKVPPRWTHSFLEAFCIKRALMVSDLQRLCEEVESGIRDHDESDDVVNMEE